MSDLCDEEESMASSAAAGKKRKLNDGTAEAQKVVRVYADGIFDMFHFGHAKALEQCKNLFPNVYLLVGVCDDALTRKMKGRTVMNEYERAESLRHCRHVDEVVEHAPWTIDQEFLDKHRIDYVAHDSAPYPSSAGQEDVYAYVKSIGKFASTQRTEGISTSDLINRVVKDYDAFVRRNLQRGYSRQEMNVGFLKGQRLKAENKLEEMKHSVDELALNVRQRSDEMVAESKEVFKLWLENSQRFMDDFLTLFGRRGTLNRLLKEKTEEFEENFKKFAQRSPM